jgi:hypothetical protein
MEKSGRSKSFSTNEINLLIMSVESNKKVVESKKKRTVTNKEKAKMWKKIALSFNSQTIEGINRDAKVLKEKWTNFKRVTVKKYASDKTNMYYVGYFHEFPPVTDPCFWKV